MRRGNLTVGAPSSATPRLRSRANGAPPPGPNLRRTIDQYWEVARQGRDRVGLEGYVQLNCAMYLSLVPRVDDPGLPPARPGAGPASSAPRRRALSRAQDDWRLDATAQRPSTTTPSVRAPRRHAPARGAGGERGRAGRRLAVRVADVWSPGSTDEEYAPSSTASSPASPTLPAAGSPPTVRPAPPDRTPQLRPDGRHRGGPCEDAVLLMLQEEAAAQGTVYEPPPPQAPPQAAPPEKVHRVEDGAFLERLCAERLLAATPPTPPAPALRRPSSSLYPRHPPGGLAEPADKAMRRSDLRHSRELSVR
eukprot:tig00021493_g21849.t1